MQDEKNTLRKLPKSMHELSLFCSQSTFLKQTQEEKKRIYVQEKTPCKVGEKQDKKKGKPSILSYSEETL